MKITGKIETYQDNNVVINDKCYFIQTPDLEVAKKNFPAGMVVTLKTKDKDKGTCEGMAKPTAPEMKSYEQDERARIAQKGGQPLADNPAFQTAAQIKADAAKDLLKTNLEEAKEERAAREASAAQATADGDNNLCSTCTRGSCLKRGDGPSSCKDRLTSTPPPAEPAAVPSGKVPDCFKKALCTKGCDGKKDPCPFKTKALATANTASKPTLSDSVKVSPPAQTSVPEEEKRPANVIVHPLNIRVTIAATVNLLNYENVKVEVEADDAATAKAVLVDTLNSLATRPAYKETRELIQSYVARVFDQGDA